MSQTTNHTHVPEQDSTDQKVRQYSVILCRGDRQAVAEAADDYESALTAIGISDVRHVPLLEFTFRHEDRLLEHLNDDEKFEGLILTSPRAAEAVSRVANSETRNRWSRKKKVFTLGPKTAARAHADGLTRKLHQEIAGNSRILATSIVKQYEDEDSVKINFLMPCSSIARDELPVILRDHGFTVTIVHAYDTVARQDAHEVLEATIKSLKSENVIIVFFSPSNVDAVVHHLKQTKCDKRLFYASIGSTTTSALESHDMPVTCTSVLPTAASLAQTIKLAFISS